MCSASSNLAYPCSIAHTCGAVLCWLCVQAFAAQGDIASLDLQLFSNMLSSCAEAITPDTNSLLHQAQQQLHHLSADACQVLLEELLHQHSAGSTSSSSGGGGGGSNTDTGPLQAAAGPHPSGPAWSFLLRHALLPKLQCLGAAAPKPVLACLTVLGECTETALCMFGQVEGRVT